MPSASESSAHDRWFSKLCRWTGKNSSDTTSARPGLLLPLTTGPLQDGFLKVWEAIAQRDTIVSGPCPE